MDRPTPAELILKRNVRWILLRPNPAESPEISTRFANGLQEIAEGSRLGIPLALSSDPRHAVSRIAPSSPSSTPNMSQWPDLLALAAAGDSASVREFARMATQEVRAIGLQVPLSPMADVVTEPRWNRIAGTFGEDAARVSTLVKAYVEGMQGPRLTPASALCVISIFPATGQSRRRLIRITISANGRPTTAKASSTI